MAEGIEAIYNFLKLSDYVATAGQPTEEQFAAIKEAGYQVIVNLAPPNSTNAIPHEREIVESLGLKYTHIPVAWTKPTFGHLDQFFPVVMENTEIPIFIHCAKNMRVSVFMYLYHRLYDRWDDQQAKSDLHKIWIPNETWQEFIQRAIYDYGPIFQFDDPNAIGSRDFWF
ncbi:MAG: protein tyrosine phosphatase family protein [Candidatus Parcubacteria bacterium]|nr:protein tyrosine phosphatase family protein [Leptolyngbyaceae cyanobacterium LF-bin-113]